MVRYVVTMDDGSCWELSAGSVVEAAERADDSARRWGLQPARADGCPVRGERACEVRRRDG